jgi:hypothetical protein
MAALKRGVAPSPGDAVEEDAEEEAAAAADLGRADAAMLADAAKRAQTAAARAAADAADAEDDSEDEEDEDGGDWESHREAEQAAEALRFSRRASAPAGSDAIDAAAARAASFSAPTPDADADADAEQAQQPAWQSELDRFQEEVARRADAGEDMSFLSDADAPEPPWVTQLLASRALENFFTAEALAELEAERDAAEEESERAYAAGSEAAFEHSHDDCESADGADGDAFGGDMEGGYGSMEELLAALTRERGAEGAARATVFGPDPPPAPPPPGGSARAR